MFFSLSILSSFTIKIMSFDGYGSLMLLNITLDGNGVDSVFDEEEECILKLTYERTGGINRGWRAIQLLLQELIYLNDFRLLVWWDKNVKTTLQGRSKRNIPLAIFKNEPMGRINEFTYKS